jgi:hypothetical protein
MVAALYLFVVGGILRGYLLYICLALSSLDGMPCMGGGSLNITCSLERYLLQTQWYDLVEWY